MSQELADQLKEKECEIAQLKESLTHAESALDELRALHVVEREAIVKDATLDRYKALEAEREKWEAREG